MCHMSHSMKKIDNISKIRKYLEQYKLNALLKNYPLDLYHFQAHEILNEKLNPQKFSIIFSLWFYFYFNNTYRWFCFSDF